MELKSNLYSLEGIDGSGKSTQSLLVQSQLTQEGYKVTVLRSPDDTLLGNFLRQNVRNIDPWLRNRLFMLDFQVSMRSIIGDEHTIYLWDRYIDSVYSSNPEITLKEAQQLTGELPLPRRTYLLSMDPTYVFTERPHAVDHHSELDWLRMKQERYEELSRLHPHRIMVIDARLPKDEVTQIIVQDIKKNQYARK